MTTRRTRDPKAKPPTSDEILDGSDDALRGLAAFAEKMSPPREKCKACGLEKCIDIALCETALRPVKLPPTAMPITSGVGFLGGPTELAPSKELIDTVSTAIREALTLPLKRADPAAALALTTQSIILETLFDTLIDCARTPSGSRPFADVMSDITDALVTAKQRLEANRFNIESHWATTEAKVEVALLKAEIERSPFARAIEEIDGG